MRRRILRAELALLLAAQENLGSLLCSPVGSFLPALTIHVQAKLYGCGGKGSLVALIHPFGSKVGQRLSWWRWTLLCGMALTGRAQGGASRRRTPTCCLVGPALLARADGLRSALVLWPQALETAICSGISSLALYPALVALACSGAAFRCATSFAAERIYDVMETLSFSSPPLKLCKSPVNLKELFGNKNSLHWTTPHVETQS